MLTELNPVAAASPPARAAPTLVYVIPRFPVGSETFILREIEALRRHGVRTVVFALHRAGSPPSGSAVHCGRDWSPAATASALGWHLVRHPGRTLTALLGLPGCWRRPVYGLNAVLCALKTLPLARSLVGTRVALVHAHFANIPAEVAFFLGLLLPSRVTFSVHARDVFVAPARLAQKCRSADVVFACSRSAAERVRSLTGATNVEVVHHGLDFSDPTWDEVYAYRRRFPEQREARGRPLRLLGVGRFVRKKGFHVLIEALAVLRREGVCFDCLLVGGGPERPSLQARVDRLQLGEQVRLADFMPEILRSPQWRDCDLLVHPSVIAEDADRDGIPNVILEAFACGVPVLASDLDSIREVIDPGRTGFLAPAGQPRELAAAIVDALGSAEQIREITANARGEVRSRFDADRNVLEMLQRWHVAAR